VNCGNQHASGRTGRGHRAFGLIQQVKDEYRETRGVLWLEQLSRDLYFGFRNLRRSPDLVWLRCFP
jgi:hypothetical protein